MTTTMPDCSMRRRTGLCAALVVLTAYALGTTHAAAQLGVFPFLRIDGGPPSAHLGAAVAVGDFNNDGFDDLAMGEPDRQFDGTLDVGLVRILYGGDGALLQTDGIVPNEVPGGVIDLAAGAPGEDVIVNGTEVDDAGGVHVLLGTEDGLTVAGNRFLTLATADVDGTPGTDDGFGTALVIDRFTTDPFVDLAVGIPGMDEPFSTEDGLGSQPEVGGIRIFPGGVSGIDLSGTERLIFQGTTGLLGTPTTDDAFGAALVSADFNGDGFVDLAVGVPGEEELGTTQSGAVQILYGTISSGLQTTNNQFFVEGTFDTDVDPFDRFGTALAAGDFNADGRSDLAIGAPLDNSLGFVNAGEVSILYGTAQGLTVAGAQLANMIFFDDLMIGDTFGAALAAGRFTDRIGGDDLAIGVPNVASNGTTQSGAVVVIFSAFPFVETFEDGSLDRWDSIVP